MTKLRDRTAITTALLYEIFDYKDGLLYWKKTKYAKIGSIAGCITNGHSGYRRVIYVGSIPYRASRLIFFWHYGYFPEVVDHIDHNPLNDRIENLRGCSQRQNSFNSSPAKNSSSQYLGVSWNKNKKVWTASIKINNRQKHLGTFKTEASAALAYNRMAVMHYKEFANLNIIAL